MNRTIYFDSLRILDMKINNKNSKMQVVGI